MSDTLYRQSCDSMNALQFMSQTCIVAAMHGDIVYESKMT